MDYLTLDEIKKHLNLDSWFTDDVDVLLLMKALRNYYYTVTERKELFIIQLSPIYSFAPFWLKITGTPLRRRFLPY